MYYTPYGEKVQSAITGLNIFNKKYTGQVDDSTTEEPDGLMYYNARYYDPAIGRFISADSVVSNPGYSQSFNRYMYVVGNPITFNDPSGFEPATNSNDPAHPQTTNPSSWSGGGGHGGGGVRNRPDVPGYYGNGGFMGPLPGGYIMGPGIVIHGDRAFLNNMSDDQSSSVDEASSPDIGSPQDGYGTTTGGGHGGRGIYDSFMSEMKMATNFDFGYDHMANATYNWSNGYYGHAAMNVVSAECEIVLDYIAFYGGARLVGMGVSAVEGLYARVATRIVAAGAGAGAGGNFIDKIIRAGNAIDRNGLTAAGRSLQKHGSRAGSVFPRATGSVESINMQGETILREILNNSAKTSTLRYHARFGDVLELKIPGGYGARFSADGNIFLGFIEP
jgi:RHS repeat-associated protein